MGKESENKAISTPTRDEGPKLPLGIPQGHKPSHKHPAARIVCLGHPWKTCDCSSSKNQETELQVPGLRVLELKIHISYVLKGRNI